MASTGAGNLCHLSLNCSIQCSFSSSASQCIFSLQIALWLRGQITYTPLSLDTYKISRCNTLQYSPQSEYGKYRTQAQIHLDSLSTVGRTIGKEAESAKVILMSALLYRCETWNASMKHHDKTYPGQAWSVHKLKCALRWIFSTDTPMLHQTRKDRNWWRDQILSAWEVNLHESSRRISNCLATLTWKSKISPGKQKKHTWRPFTRKLQRNNKTHPVHVASQKSARTELGNDGGIRLTRHSKQQKKRQGKYSRLWSERLSNLMVTTKSTHFTISKAQAAKE